MSKVSVFLKIDAESVAERLLAVRTELDGCPVETILDFSSVLRIDPKAVVELEKLACLADEKAVKIGMRGVNVEIYKVLKLVKLTSRFSFLT